MKNWRSLLALALLLVAFTVGGSWLKKNRSVTSVGNATISDGTEIVMVFLASSDCAGIRDPNLLRALERIRLGLGRQAHREGHKFVSVGVSLDLEHRLGIRLLERFGPFDELILGRGWLNSGAIKYIWEDIRGLPGIPQVVVTSRTIVAGRTIQVHNEELLLRKVGVQQIVTWSDLGFPAVAPASSARPEF